MKNQNEVPESSTYHALPGERVNLNRREEIIQILKENNYSVSDLLEKLGKAGYEISESSLRLDIKFLRDDGYTISRHKGVYFLENVSEERKLLSLRRESDADLLDDLANTFFLFWENPEREWSFSEIYDTLFSFRSKYYVRRNILNVLLNEYMITCYGRGRGVKYKYSYFYNHYKLPSKDKLFKLLVVQSNLSEYVYNIAFTQLTQENYFNQEQRDISGLKDLPEYIRILDMFDYKNTPISFIYNNQPYNFFLVGLIVYVEKTGKLYLVGKPNPSLNRTEYKVLLASNILWDTVKRAPDADNFRKLYVEQNYWETLRSNFQSIKNEMFVISSDPAENVAIFVGNEFNQDDPTLEQRKHDFKMLSENRSTGILKTEENGDIYYYDTIRGMSDFAKFIRKYGTSITVMKSARLRKQVRETAKRTLTNYEKYEEWNNG